MSSIKSGSQAEDRLSEDDNFSASGYESQAPSEIASSANVSSVDAFPVYELNLNMSMSDIKGRLSQLIKCKGQDLVQACKNFDRRSTDKIPKSQLRQVIGTFCFPISADKFDGLCDELQMNVDGKINYYDFFSKLSGTELQKTNRSSQKIPDNVSVYEVELMVKRKIKDNLRNVIRSFWLFDINKDGLVQKNELRRIIQNYCFDIDDDVFNNFWNLYNQQNTDVINYKDFLINLGVNTEKYKKYMPPDAVNTSLCLNGNQIYNEGIDRRYEQRCKQAALENKDHPAVRGLPIEEIMIIFNDRIKKQHKVLKNAFKVFDPEDKGRVSVSDFRGIVNFFVLAMSTSLFDLVMEKLDIDISADGLDYMTFLEKKCKSDDDKNFKTRNCGKINSTCVPVIQRLKICVLNPEARLHSVFTKISTDQEWQITRQELKKALDVSLDFKITDDDFKELNMILDPQNTNVINCMDFIHLLEGSDNTCCPENIDLSEVKKSSSSEKYSTLEGRKLYSKFKHHLNKNLNNIEKAILVRDPDLSGFILPEVLKDILSVFCFPLTNDQFEEITCHLRKYRDSFNYHEFLKLFEKTSDEDTEKWTAIINKLVNLESKYSPEIPFSEVEELLKDCIQFRKTALLKDFKAMDVCNVGITSKDDFRYILSKYAFRLNDKQLFQGLNITIIVSYIETFHVRSIEKHKFLTSPIPILMKLGMKDTYDKFDEFWKGLPQNKFNQLLYEKFLEKYSSNFGNTAVKSKEASEQRPKSKEKMKEEKVLTKETGKKCVTFKSTENRKNYKENCFLKAPHLKKIFEPIESVIIKNLRSIRFHLRRADKKSTGMIDFVSLKSILAKSAIYFSNEDEFHILEYFDPHLTGKINYHDFLRIFAWYA